MIGKTLGRYRIVEKLGPGGMSEVFVADDLELRRKVALKVLPPAMAADPVSLSRFRREARSLAALSHPGIVVIHSVEEAEGLHFLTMELVERSQPGGVDRRRSPGSHRFLQCRDAVDRRHRRRAPAGRGAP